MCFSCIMFTLFTMFATTNIANEKIGSAVVWIVLANIFMITAITREDQLKERIKKLEERGKDDGLH